MQRIDLDSELLKPMRDRIENMINNLLLVAVEESKESEINLKINISSQERSQKNDEGEDVYWIEPRFDYQISEKIKENKNSYKGFTGQNYELRIDKDKKLYVQKVNEQTNLF